MNWSEWKSAAVIVGVLSLIVAVLALAHDFSTDPPASPPPPSTVPTPSPTPSATPAAPILPAVDASDDDASASGVPPGPLKLEHIVIDDGGNLKVPDGKYTFGNSNHASVSLHWHVYSNRGQVMGEDCDVEVRMTHGDGTPVGTTTRSNTCAPVDPQGHYDLYQPGHYHLYLKVTYQGQTLQEKKDINVYTHIH